MEPPDLGMPVTELTGDMLEDFRDDPAACYRALASAGVRFEVLPMQGQPGSCGWMSAVELQETAIPYEGENPMQVTCAVAAALHIWEIQVVAPAAQRRFGERIEAILQAGTYSCRYIDGARGRLSEHAFANAADVRGFRLEGGREVLLTTGWNGGADERAFLRDVRDGACVIFPGVLSPDANPAHRDHFHFDMGPFQFCR